MAKEKVDMQKGQYDELFKIMDRVNNGRMGGVETQKRRKLATNATVKPEQTANKYDGHGVA